MRLLLHSRRLSRHLSDHATAKACKLQGSLCVLSLSASAKDEHRHLICNPSLVTTLYRRGSEYSPFVLYPTFFLRVNTWSDCVFQLQQA